MGGILDKLDEWLRGLLIEGITGNLSGMFDTVNTKVGEIAGEVGQTPLAWNSGVFSMIRNLSETVIVPIAGVIMTFVMCYELIQLVTEKNNLHDVDTWMFFKWISFLKSSSSVLIDQEIVTFPSSFRRSISRITKSDLVQMRISASLPRSCSRSFRVF